MLICTVNYLGCRTPGFTRVLVFWEMNISPAEVGDGDVKWAARLDIHDTFSCHTRMNIGHVFFENKLYQT